MYHFLECIMEKNRTLIYWIISVILTLIMVVYQRMTGPTQPVRGKVELAGETIKYKLIRTYGGLDDAEIVINDPTEKLTGNITYKRFKSFDSLTSVPLSHQGGKLIAHIPHQPPAGKVEYWVKLSDGTTEVNLTEEPVIMRFKGDVPAYILIPHILLMFFAMLFSTRTGVEAIAKGKRTLRLSIITLVLLIGGGLILGPIVQKFAFGAYWTGWPFGHDLTDNKTAIAFIFWAIAIYQLVRNSQKRGWAIAAAVITALVYLIPHSVLGSEIDHTAKTPNHTVQAPE
jgi:hypothetical protein